uniref:Uncharacterized protein n=1 Tax=Ditylenchus dipsaci TaxID=166011 RepID=A0A915DLJ6_9BILA
MGEKPKLLLSFGAYDRTDIWMEVGIGDYNADGLDLAWSYEQIEKLQYQQQLARLVKEIRIQRHRTHPGFPIIIVVTVKGVLEPGVIAALKKVVDYVLLDRNLSPRLVIAHHARLFKDKSVPEAGISVQPSIEQLVDSWLSLGFPKQKLLVSVSLRSAAQEYFPIQDKNVVGARAFDINAHNELTQLEATWTCMRRLGGMAIFNLEADDKELPQWCASRSATVAPSPFGLINIIANKLSCGQVDIHQDIPSKKPSSCEEGSVRIHPTPDWSSVVLEMYSLGANTSVLVGANVHDLFCSSPVIIPIHQNTSIYSAISPCFQQVVIPFLPTAIFAPISISTLVVSKLGLCILHCLISMFHTVYAFMLVDDQKVDYFKEIRANSTLNILFAVCCLLSYALCIRAGVISNGLLHICWCLKLLALIPEGLIPSDNFLKVTDLTFFGYLLCSCLMFVLLCRADGHSTTYERLCTKPESPESTSSAISSLLYWYASKMIWKGLKATVDFDELWALEKENQAEFLRDKFLATGRNRSPESLIK